MKARNPNTGTLETVYVKALDSMPVGSVVEFTGSSADVPAGWEEVYDYSTTEVNTGKKWIDGKDIYRQVLTDTYSASGSAEFTINLPITSTVDTMISYDGTHGVTSGTLTRYKNRIGFPTTTGINYSSTMYFDSTNNRIVVIIGGKGSAAVAWCTVIVEYTKTS